LRLARRQRLSPPSPPPWSGGSVPYYQSSTRTEVVTRSPANLHANVERVRPSYEVPEKDEDDGLIDSSNRFKELDL
jgi:hypothetical protein